MGSLLPQPPPQGSPPPARSLYPPITSDGARQRYKQEFDTDLKRYKQLCAEMDSINDRLNQLSRRLDSITEDSPQYQVCPGGGSREGCGAAAGQWGSTASGMLWGTGDAAWVWGCCKAVGLLWGSGAAVGHLGLCSFGADCDSFEFAAVHWGCCRAPGLCSYGDDGGGFGAAAWVWGCCGALGTAGPCRTLLSGMVVTPSLPPPPPVPIPFVGCGRGVQSAQRPEAGECSGVGSSGGATQPL